MENNVKILKKNVKNYDFYIRELFRLNVLHDLQNQTRHKINIIKNNKFQAYKDPNCVADMNMKAMAKLCICT